MPLFTPTRHCLKCFKPLSEDSLYHMFHPDSQLCDSCFKQFKPWFKTSRLVGVNTLIIYPYDEIIKTLLYQLKGCFDYALAPIFLDRYLALLKLRYHHYVMVPAPSHIEDDDQRGFNHVEAIFSGLGLQKLKLFTKTENIKQSDLSRHERQSISKRIRLKSNPDLSKMKILLVDDVLTTGATLKAMIELVKPLKPKRLEILVLSQSIFDQNKEVTNQKRK